MSHPPCGNRTNRQAITKKCESVFVKRERYAGRDSMLCASCPGHSGEPLGQLSDDARAISETARLAVGTKNPGKTHCRRNGGAFIPRGVRGRVHRRLGKPSLTQRTGVGSHCTWGHPLHSACFSRLPCPRIGFGRSGAYNSCFVLYIARAFASNETRGRGAIQRCALTAQHHPGELHLWLLC